MVTRSDRIDSRIRERGDGLFNLIVEGGPVVVSAESWQVCANIQDALLYPDKWEPTEAYEIADRFRG